ncbi:hypothetical protein [Brevundimonas sp. TWP2-3-4b1]|uniref:hypothetical protein n=1 Tax=Brevundimonas sp. TWP2-3-4b1 TaxID=2804580 RepID=UPI003CF0428C
MSENLAAELTRIRDRFLMATPDKDHTDYAIITRCIAALSPSEQPEPVACPSLEQVARVVDPDAWEHVDACHERMKVCGPSELEALRTVVDRRLRESGSITTAEQIVALYPQPSKQTGVAAIAQIIKAELVFCLTSEPDASVEIENAEEVARAILAALSTTEVAG